LPEASESHFVLPEVCETSRKAVKTARTFWKLFCFATKRLKFAETLTKLLEAILFCQKRLKPLEKSTKLPEASRSHFVLREACETSREAVKIVKSLWKPFCLAKSV